MAAPLEPTLPGTIRATSPEKESIRLAGIADTASPTDELGFRPYVDAITAYLTAPSTTGPLTLSVEGPWGSGKSSFMLQVQQALTTDRHRIIKFNPWRHDKEDALWAAFALDTLRQLRENIPWAARLRASIRLFAYRFDWRTGWSALLQTVGTWTAFLSAVIIVGYLAFSRHDLAVRLLTGTPKPTATDPLASLLTAIGGFGIYVLLVATGWQYLVTAFGNPFERRLHQHLRSPDYEGHIAFIERFQHDFTKVLDGYAGTNKLFVFIDDLDRCDIPKGAELMKALNLMIGDDRRLIFIIGMDRAKIAAGLSVAYEKLLPYLTLKKDMTPADALAVGHEYIEKFIQLPFLLPTPRPISINEFLHHLTDTPYNPKDEFATLLENQARRRHLTITVENDSNTIITIARELAPALHNNPRRIKHFLNLFRLQVYMGHATGLFDAIGEKPVVTLQQVGKIVAITLRWPRLLEDVSNGQASLDTLERAALDQAASPTDREKYWLSIGDLILLLKTGITRVPQEPPVEPWTLQVLDLDTIRRVAPRITEQPEVNQDTNPSVRLEAQAGSHRMTGADAELTVDREAAHEIGMSPDHSGATGRARIGQPGREPTSLK